MLLSDNKKLSVKLGMVSSKLKEARSQSGFDMKQLGIQSEQIKQMNL